MLLSDDYYKADEYHYGDYYYNDNVVVCDSHDNYNTEECYCGDDYYNSDECYWGRCDVPCKVHDNLNSGYNWDKLTRKKLGHYEYITIRIYVNMYRMRWNIFINFG